MLKISLDAARKLAIHTQHLAEPKHSSPGKEQIFKLVRGLSYLQIDPISAVAPSQRIVLWSRLGSFKLADFDSLMWKERKLFEYYAHAASIVLTEDYPIHEARMRAYVNGHGIPKSWHVIIQTWMKRNNALRLYVLKELKRRGPLASREIEDLSAKPWRSSGWTNERNVDRMLHFLQAQGKIIVSGRSGNQKLWDLSERFLPLWTPRTRLTDYEIDRTAMQKSLRALGLATQKQIMEHFSSGRYSNPSSVLEDLESEGIISEVELDGIRNGKKWYVHSKDLPTLDQILSGKLEGSGPTSTTLLSPFDNLIIDRPRTKLLFDFEMSFEIYVPKSQRKFGYYVLPILHEGKLIGRIDPLMDRKTGTLQIHAIYAERTAPKTRETGRAIALAIEELSTFLGAKQVRYASRIPDFWKTGDK